MRKLGELASEIVGSVWLVIVAVQFLDRYFGTRSLDLTYTYWAMLIILAGLSCGRMVSRLGRREPSTSTSRGTSTNQAQE